jgi:hypothetical protein
MRVRGKKPRDRNTRLTPYPLQATLRAVLEESELHLHSAVRGSFRLS